MQCERGVQGIGRPFRSEISANGGVVFGAFECQPARGRALGIVARLMLSTRASDGVGNARRTSQAPKPPLNTARGSPIRETKSEPLRFVFGRRDPRWRSRRAKPTTARIPTAAARSR